MRPILNVALLFLFVFCASCEPDLKEVDRIASIQAEEPVDISLGVTVIFSDSAKVKARLVAPEMRNYQAVERPYYEFQKGLTIYFFDEQGVETQRITSDYAIRRELEEIVEFRKNVVITRADGVQIKTEELIHNERENTFYNQSPIAGYSKDGRNTFQGASFSADGDFKNIEVQNTTGVMYLEGDRKPGF